MKIDNCAKISHRSSSYFNLRYRFLNFHLNIKIKIWNYLKKLFQPNSKLKLVFQILVYFVLSHTVQAVEVIRKIVKNKRGTSLLIKLLK